MMAQGDVPVLRGMRAGLVALRNLGLSAAPPPEACRPRLPVAGLHELLAGQSGPMSPDLTRRILAAYGLPLVRSAVAASAEDAVAVADGMGYPLVLKIASRDIPHRSDIGGVALGIADADALRAAIAGMLARVRAARPDARIEGFELQEHLADQVEAMAGFVAAPPFGALITIGTGGTMVELQDDHGIDLCPITEARAAGMIASTRLGRALAGYRNLIPSTDIAPLAGLAAALSRLAAELSGRIVECDLNPILVRKGSGEVRIADALLVASPERAP
jgi:acetyltransferase